MQAAVKTWRLRPHERAALDPLAKALGVSPIVAQLLLNRGFQCPEDGRRFLDAPLVGLHGPDLLPGAGAAAERLLAAVRERRRICIYGDYDVDGVTGTAILWHALRLLDAPADFYVPHRLEEGYGLNCEALRQLAERGVSLVVTVDCGIASVEEAEEARRLGLELLITDHHEFRDTLPSAAVLVHPRLPNTSYPFGGLSGSGVAFKVAWALCQRHCGSEKVTPRFKEFLLEAVVLAALGTVADVVPLLDENRILVRYGLRRLWQKPPPGLQALLEATQLAGKDRVLAEDVGFKLAPRLNAVGRLGCARLVVELLTTTSKQRAAELARFLEEQNLQRQKLERRMLAEARALLEADGAIARCALVLAKEDWHAGVLGIVAGRLAERYALPALLIASGNDPAIGSGRSTPGFALHEALHACGEDLVSHGGHAAAAGFKVARDRIDAFRERFCAYAGRLLAERNGGPHLEIDAEVPLHVLTRRFVADLSRLEPYGAHNPRPLFLAGDLAVVGTPRRVGHGERHLSFRVRQGGTTVRAIAFNAAERFDELLSQNGACSLVFSPRLSEWQGFSYVDLEVHDFQPGPQARIL